MQLDRKSADTLVILHGDSPFHTLSKDEITGYQRLLAVDGALDTLLDAEIVPDLVIGDLDSVSRQALERFRTLGGEIIHETEQESNDFDKALRICHYRGWRWVDVIGFRGSRLDRELATWDVAARFTSRIELRFIDPLTIAIPMVGRSSLRLDDASGRMCSIIPLLPCMKVSLEGFRWPLKGESLRFGGLVSDSNMITSPRATVSLAKGVLLVIIHRGTGKTL